MPNQALEQLANTLKVSDTKLEDLSPELNWEQQTTKAQNKKTPANTG